MKQSEECGWLQCLIGGLLIGRLARENMFFFFLILMPLTYVLYITGLMHLDFLKVKIDQENCFHYLDNVSVCSEVFETFGEYIQQWLHYYS